MVSRSPAPMTRRVQLPDLPGETFDDDMPIYIDPPVRRRPSPAPPARRSAAAVRRTSDRRDFRPGDDIVTSVSMRTERTPRSVSTTTRSGAWSWSTPILPSGLQVVEQALPNLLMTVSALAVLALGTFTPFGVPVWAAGIFIPSVLLALVSSGPIHMPRQRAALVNIATMAMIFPVLVIRQSIVRVPFVDGDNGTLLAPSIATAAVIGLLLILALACAVLSQEDPEYSGIMFLPAAMMVPLLAGQSDLVSLPSALLLATAIFGVSALLTVLASMLPGAFPALIAPAAIGLEFVLLTVFRNASLFPTGAGSTAKVLFFAIVVATLIMAIVVPMLSVWTRQVTRLAQSRSLAHA